MHGVNIIERAFQLASESGSVSEVRRKLNREGYGSVEAHLFGRQIQSEINSRLNPALRGALRTQSAAPTNEQLSTAPADGRAEDCSVEALRFEDMERSGEDFASDGMQSFRILYFQESVLESAEEVRVRDILEAIEKASGKPPHIRAEVWSDKGRVGEIGASPTA